MKKGTKIYYTGDQANIGGFGIVTRSFEDKWGKWSDIKMDDGRDFSNTPTNIISTRYHGTCGSRFVTKEAYDAYRTEALRQYTT
tara:strand:+ start:1741 stop:1992 length:252 start_codon:yes stop_codon:yes gene_type:complete